MDFYTCEISVEIRDSFYFCIHDMYKARNKENLNSTLTCAFILYYSVVSNKSDKGYFKIFNTFLRTESGILHLRSKPNLFV